MGTLQRWRQHGVLDFKHMKVVVFDEADVMLGEEGFGDHSLVMMNFIDNEAELPQVLLFSATYNEKVRTYAETLFSTFQRPAVQKAPLQTSGISKREVDLCAKRGIVIGHHFSGECESQWIS